MNITTRSYVAQCPGWPRQGKHILASFDTDSIVVYQAYRPSIARFAATHGYFGGDFSFERMSWIKPGFLWMMYRSGWASKRDQERVLAVRIKRSGFEQALASAVHSRFVPEVYETREHWRQALQSSPVRLQWDPDHDPHGNRQERRAIQLGLRADMLRAYGRAWIVSIEDITDFVHAQHARVQAGELERLETPLEQIYPLADSALAARLQLSPGPPTD